MYWQAANNQLRYSPAFCATLESTLISAAPGTTISVVVVGTYAAAGRTVRIARDASPHGFTAVQLGGPGALPMGDPVQRRH